MKEGSLTVTLHFPDWFYNFREEICLNGHCPVLWDITERQGF